MTSNAEPPEEVKRAAKVVDNWVRSQEQQQAQPRERAIDRFARHIRSDTPAKMPDWKDPRSA